jgi:hypothetical protein
MEEPIYTNDEPPAFQQLMLTSPDPKSIMIANQQAQINELRGALAGITEALQSQIPQNTTREKFHKNSTAAEEVEDDDDYEKKVIESEALVKRDEILNDPIRLMRYLQRKIPTLAKNDTLLIITSQLEKTVVILDELRPVWTQLSKYYKEIAEIELPKIRLAMQGPKALVAKSVDEVTAISGLMQRAIKENNDDRREQLGAMQMLVQRNTEEMNIIQGQLLELQKRFDNIAPYSEYAESIRPPDLKSINGSVTPNMKSDSEALFRDYSDIDTDDDAESGAEDDADDNADIEPAISIASSMAKSFADTVVLPPQELAEPDNDVDDKTEKETDVVKNYLQHLNELKRAKKNF